MPITILVLMFILIEEELRCTYLWWQNNVGEGDSRLGNREMMRQAITFMKLHMVHL